MSTTDTKMTLAQAKVIINEGVLRASEPEQLAAIMNASVPNAAAFTAGGELHVVKTQEVFEYAKSQGAAFHLLKGRTWYTLKLSNTRGDINLSKLCATPFLTPKDGAIALYAYQIHNTMPTTRISVY